MSKFNPEGSIRFSNLQIINTVILASFDLYADEYIHSSELEKVKMLTEKSSVKWIVMQVRQQEVLDYYFAST